MNFLKTTFLCVLVTFAVHESQGQQIGLSLHKDSTRAIIPFRTYNNLIVIGVNINGRTLLDFIVDTSVQFTVLSEKSIGDELGFNYLRKIPMGTNADGANFGYSANELNIELGNGVFSGDNHSILVLENDFLGLSNLAQVPIYGLIGKDIFEHFVVEIDQDRQVLILNEPASFVVPTGYDPIPMKIENGKPKINVDTIFENWDELSEYMLLKTGAAHTVFFDSDQNIYLIPPKKIETILGVSGAGEVGGYIGRVREVKLGSNVFEEPIASFTKEQEKDKNRGSIGMGFLSRMNMIVDFQGGTLFLKPSRSFGKTFEYDLSGIKINTVGEAFYIRYVQKGSPAEKVGINTGDQLVAVNGERLTSKNFNKVVSVFSSKVGKKITLTLSKDGTETEVTFKLMRFI